MMTLRRASTIPEHCDSPAVRSSSPSLGGSLAGWAGQESHAHCRDSLVSSGSGHSTEVMAPSLPPKHLIAGRPDCMEEEV